MRHHFFAVAMLLPAVAFCLVMLSTFYGWVKAYLTISWIPMALYLIIQTLMYLSFEPNGHPIKLDWMLQAVGWTSLFQGLAGAAITVVTLYKKENWVIPAIAALLTIMPFFLIR